MARPKLADADRLTEKVDTVLTPGDRERLDAYCRDTGIGRAALLRSWIVQQLDSLAVDTDVPARNGG